MTPEVSHANYAAMFKEKITELQGEPAFKRTTQPMEYAVDKKGIPLVKAAVGNVPLTYDLWKGLRNRYWVIPFKYRALLILHKSIRDKKSI